MVKFRGKFSIVLASWLLFLSVVFQPIVSYSTPNTHETTTVSSPTRLWLMSPEDDERCRQDTERYNAAWKAAWYATHPGQGPAPTPSPPYVCPPPPPDNTPAPVTPTPVTPNKPIVPGTNQGTGLPNELENKPGNTPELNTGLGKPGEYKPGYDPATGLPVNGAEQANPNPGDPNDPQTGELARWAAAHNTSPSQGDKPIVPANEGLDNPKSSNNLLKHRVKEEKPTRDPDDSSNDIIDEVQICGKTIPLRRGYYDNTREKGFGFDKIKYKHRPDDPTIILELMANNPDSKCGKPNVNSQTGEINKNRKQFDIHIFRNACTTEDCKVTGHFILRVIVDESPLINPKTGKPVDGKMVGIITAYPVFDVGSPDAIQYTDDISPEAKNTKFPKWFQRNTRAN